MTTDIFIKSYRGDFEWLPGCLHSIQKYATGFRDVVIVVPDTDSLDHLTVEKVIKVTELGHPYMFQQVVKMFADTYTNADFISFVDSDCVFTSPVTPETFMTNGKPNWLHTPWDKTGEDARSAWGDVMLKCIGEFPPSEFMRRHPQLVPRWALEEFRGFVSSKHGVSLDHYILNQPGRCFSEFNCLGFFLWLHHREKFHWINTEEWLPPAVLKQFWSHGGMTPDIENEIATLLA